MYKHQTEVTDDNYDDVTRIEAKHFSEGVDRVDGTRAEPGWYWWEEEYREEGAWGPYETREAALAVIDSYGNPWALPVQVPREV